MANYYNNITYFDGSYWSNQGVVEFAANHYRTDKIPIINNTVIISQKTYFIGFWNDNTYLGHYTDQTSSYFVDNNYLGTIDLNLNVPANATHFHLVGAAAVEGNLYPMDYSTFQNIQIIYSFTPERGILKGRRNYLSFDGVNDYVDFGSGTISQEFDGSSYIEVEIDFELDVIKTDRQVLGDFVVADSSNSGQSMIYIVSRNNGSLWVGGRSNVNDTFQQVEFSSVLSPNTKYNVRALYDFQNDEIKVWLDNILLGTQNVSFGSSTFQDSSFDGVNDIIGANSGGLSNYLNGDIYYFSILSNTTQVEYLFNEGSGTTLNDNVGTNDGTIVGATWGEEGEPLSAIYKGSPSYALSFDGVDDWVDLGFVPPSSNNARTFYTTFKLSQETAKWFLSYGDEVNGGDRFSFEVSSQKIRLDIRGDVVELDYTIPLNEWVTYVFTMPNGTNDLLNTENYINGQLVNLTRVAGVQTNINTGNSNTLRLGRLNDFSLYATISVKELGAFNNYNNSTVVNNLFNNGIQGNETGLVSYYDFTDGTGITLTDSVGNNNGTINGATWSSPLNEIQRVYKGSPSRYLSFDGVNDYVDLGTLGNWASNNLDDFTIEMKVQLLDDKPQSLLDSGDYSTRLQINYEQSFNSLLIALKGNNVVALPVASYTPSNVDILTFSYSNNTFEIKVNGVSQNITYLFDLDTVGSPFLDFIYNVYIGRGNIDGNNVYTQMNLYDFKIYNGSTLFLHYDMSEGQGNTLVDKVGNNDGTIYGATWKDDSLIYFPKTLDSIAYGNLTYRDIFEGTNLVSNGDFSNGTTGWLANNGTLSSSNGNLIYNVTSSTLYPTIIPTADSTVTGVRYYVATNVKANVSTLTPIILRIRDVPYTDIAQVTPSQNNVFTFLSGILTAPNVNRPRIDTSVASGDELVIDYMLQIDLDDLGIGHLSKEQMDELYNEYLFIKAYYS